MDGRAVNRADQEINSVGTAPDGTYSFTGLLPGSYFVQVVSQSGYIATSSTNVEISDNDGAAETVNFGEFEPISVSGVIFDDLTGSGTFTSGDTGLSGWTVELVQGSNVMQTTSGSGGDYTFSGVGPGSWTLEVARQSGWEPTNSPITITPSSGTDLTSENLGESQGLSISGQVFNDVAGSGSYSSADPGLDAGPLSS